MKNGIILLLLLLSYVLAGCGAPKEEARFDAFRAALSDAAVTVTAEVGARDSDGLEDFTLRCAETADGYDVEVLAPEIVQGVRGHVGADGTTLAFDDLILPMPQAADTVSPLCALPTVLAAARDGYVNLIWQEEDALVVQLVPDDDTTVRLYFDGDNVPAAAEIDVAGHTVVFCAIREWNTEM